MNKLLNVIVLLQVMLRADSFVHALSIVIIWFRSGAPEQAEEKLSELLKQLSNSEKARTLFAELTYQWLTEQHLYYSFVHIGMYSRYGIFRQSMEAIYDTINPKPRAQKYLHDVLKASFDANKDIS